jgi:excisionase family DNA binding protein
VQLALDSAPPPLLSAQEVADQLGVAERTVRRWIQSGKLPAKKTGRSFAIRLEDVERVIGVSIRRRIAVRTEERAKELEAASLQAKLELLQELYAMSQAQLAESQARVARLEYELEQREAQAA